MLYAALLCIAVLKLFKGVNLLYNAWLVSKVGALMSYNTFVTVTPPIASMVTSAINAPEVD